MNRVSLRLVLVIILAFGWMAAPVPPASTKGQVCTVTKTVSGAGRISVKKVCKAESEEGTDWAAVVAQDEIVKVCEDAKAVSDSDIYAGCVPKADSSASPEAKKDIAGAVQKALATLQIPPTEINIGPDPSVNEWNMVAVGEPIWLWSAEATSLSNTVTTDGITVSVAAARSSLVFSMGDGNTVSCVTATPRPPKMLELKPSPDCGHTYFEPNKAMPITATAVWQITWSTGPYHGGLTFVMDASRTIDVGELSAVITSNP